MTNKPKFLTRKRHTQNGRKLEDYISEKDKVVVVSGGFDPLHIGHIRLFKAAKQLGTKLIVILNNDNWLYEKKSFVFMNEKDRKEILESIKYIDNVMLSFHEDPPQDMSVCSDLK